jgi:tripartite-type tricarboxylate transporter receptor subunit TctC
MKTARVMASCLAGMLCGAGVAWSQAYPAKPVRVIVPFAPAGANDMVARIVFDPLRDFVGVTPLGRDDRQSFPAARCEA